MQWRAKSVTARTREERAHYHGYKRKLRMNHPSYRAWLLKEYICTNLLHNDNTISPKQMKTMDVDNAMASKKCDSAHQGRARTHSHSHIISPTAIKMKGTVLLE